MANTYHSIRIIGLLSIMSLGIIICCIFFLQYGEFVIFDHHKNVSIYDLTVYNEQDRALLYGYYMISQPIAFFNLVSNQAAIPIKVIAIDSVREDFEKILKGKHIKADYVPHKDWEKFIKTDGVGDSYADPSHNFFTYNAILQWIERKMIEFPKHIDEKPLNLKTYEKRKIMSVKISQHTTLHKHKMAVYVVGGESSRDWMSIAIIMNYMNRLIKNLALRSDIKETDSFQRSSKSLPDILDFYNIYFIPVTNPDGYVYNMESGSGRLWAKNRKTFIKRVCDYGTDAVGVNVDRNWRIPHISGVDLECNGIYLGSNSLSEVETYTLFKRLNIKARRLMAVIVVKGFGKMITLPYSGSKLTKNHDLMMQILSTVTAKLKARFNETFLYGTTGTYLYNYTGNMADYIKEKLNIPIVFTVHLQKAEHFIPDADNIDILTSELQVILEDVLLLANDIYGPLFNNGQTHKLGIKYIVFIYIFIRNYILLQ